MRRQGHRPLGQPGALAPGTKRRSGWGSWASERRRGGAGTGGGEVGVSTGVWSNPNRLTVQTLWAVIPDTTSSYLILSAQRTTTTAYDPVGNVTQVTDPNGYQTQYLYDGLNRLRETI